MNTGLQFNISWNHGLYIQDLSTYKHLAYKANSIFEASSTIKIPIILACLDKFADSNNLLSVQLPVKKINLSNGSGVINWTRWQSLSIEELIILIAKYSDCVASNMLVGFTGGKATVNKYLKHQQLQTRLVMGNMQFTNQERTMPHVGMTTAKELAGLSSSLLGGTHKYGGQLKKAFDDIDHAWHVPYINKRKFGCERFYVKTGSMQMIGKNNDTVLNFTGIIQYHDTAYSFGYLNRVILGPKATNGDLTNFKQKICQKFLREFKEFRLKSG